MVAPNPLEFDEDGLLKDPNQWNESVALQIAKDMGIESLTETHWKIIRSLREYYAKFGTAPAMSHICHTHGMDKHCTHDLFHSCLGAWRVAGLPNPGEEAKSYLSDA